MTKFPSQIIHKKNVHDTKFLQKDAWIKQVLLLNKYQKYCTKKNFLAQEKFI